MSPPLSTTDIALRLIAATLAGSVLGLNRDLHGKAAGLRTLAMVSLGAASIALVVPLTTGVDVGAEGRVIQGLVTAIGFIGAGVIIHDSLGKKVHGLTTAACSWFAVAVGIMSGAGLWSELLIAFALSIAVLSLGGWIERRLNLLLRRPPGTEEEPGDG